MAAARTSNSSPWMSRSIRSTRGYGAITSATVVHGTQTMDVPVLGSSGGRPSTERSFNVRRARASGNGASVASATACPYQPSALPTQNGTKPGAEPTAAHVRSSSSGSTSLSMKCCRIQRKCSGSASTATHRKRHPGFCASAAAARTDQRPNPAPSSTMTNSSCACSTASSTSIHSKYCSSYSGTGVTTTCGCSGIWQSANRLGMNSTRVRTPRRSMANPGAWSTSIGAYAPNTEW